MPGYNPEYQLVIRNSKNKKIMANMMLMPGTLQAFGNKFNMYSCNFLAVHRKLREKKLA